MRSAPDVIRRAAASFMRTPFIEGRFAHCDMFDAINAISQTHYEGKAGAGRLVFAAADDPNLNFVLKFERPAALTQTRWARKLLQMATSEAALIADYNSIVGLGDLSDVSAPPFSVDFLGHDQWDLRRGEQVLMRCCFGEARLPQEPIGKERFIENMRRVFDTAVRYVAAASVPGMAFVISEDRTVDVVPLLRPSVERSKIEQAVAGIASATRPTYYKFRTFLDDHRFYLNEEQCLTVSEALDRIEAEPTELAKSPFLPRGSSHTPRSMRAT